MQEPLKSIIIQKVALYGIDVSDQDMRTIKVIAKLLNALDDMDAERAALKEKDRTFISRNYTASAIAEAAGLSRANLSRKSVYGQIIDARTPKETSVTLTKEKYDKLMAENDLFRKDKKEEVLRQIQHKNDMKEIQRLQNELTIAKSKAEKYRNEVLQLRHELAEQLEKNTLTIKIDEDAGK